MKISINFLFALIFIFFISCKGGYEQNRVGFEKINQELKEKFGAEAYYTSVSMSTTGAQNGTYVIIVNKSDNKDDIRQEQWIKDAGMWQQGGYANMQVDANSPGFYKFQLDKEVSLPLLGELIEKSKTTFQQENKDVDPELNLAIVNTNNTVTDAQQKYRYTVILKEKDNTATHSYTYDKDGKLMISN